MTKIHVGEKHDVRGSVHRLDQSQAAICGWHARVASIRRKTDGIYAMAYLGLRVDRIQMRSQ